jgi:hypothetical protein
MKVDDLEGRVIKLGQAFTVFSEDLRFAFHYIHSDSASSLTKSRMLMEKLLLGIFRIEMGSEPRRPLLGEMLADNQFTRNIDRRIVSRMNAIRDMGNLGPHGERVLPTDAAKVLDDLCEVLDWYLQKYGSREPTLLSAQTDRKTENGVQSAGPARPQGHPAQKTSRPGGVDAALLLIMAAATAGLGPVVLGAVLGLFPAWAEVPLLGRCAVASVPIGAVLLVLNARRARQVKELGRARQEEGIHELARLIIGRLEHPELMTARSVRGLAVGVEQKLGCPLLSDKILTEAIRAAALRLEDRLPGRARVEALKPLNTLLLEIDADAMPLLSLAHIDRLNGYLPSQRYLMVPLFCGLVAIGLGPWLFGLRVPAFVYPLYALLLLAQLGLWLSNVRLAAFWRREPAEAGPPPRAVAWLDVFRLMMTSRNRALDWFMDCLWGPIWEGGILWTTPPGRFEVMHEFRYEVAQSLWRRLQDLQDELDELRPDRGSDHDQHAAAFAALCRELWVVTGETRFREIEARGHITSQDFDNRVIRYL